MTDPRQHLFDYARKLSLRAPGPLNEGDVAALTHELDLLGATKAVEALSSIPGAISSPPAPVSSVGRPPATKEGLFARLTNLNAPALTEADYVRVAADLGVGVNIIKAVKKVEAPRGAFDDDGRPSILYEKHVFARNTNPKGKFNATHPTLSAAARQPGTYGPFSAQYGKLADAAALDPDAAFKACSWGAFQVLGENAVALGYASAFDMAVALTASEAAHLDCFARFVKTNGLIDELRACQAGDARSCIPFVEKYNGGGYAKNQYHIKLAEAAR